MSKLIEVKNKLDLVLEKAKDNGDISQIIGETLTDNPFSKITSYPAVIKETPVGASESAEGTFGLEETHFFPYLIVINNSSKNKTITDLLTVREKILSYFKKISINGKYEDEEDNFLPPNV